MNKVFLDTAFPIALANKKDRYHQKAISLSEQIESSNSDIITSRAIFIEIGNTLAKLRVRRIAIDILSFLEAKPKLEIVPLSEDLYSKAFNLFKERQDKEWGLIDCISFVVMQEQGVKDALTPDIHFKQAGFNALMME
jgi:hypothetical protein